MQLEPLSAGTRVEQYGFKPNLGFVMDVQVETIDKVAVVKITGQLDSTTASQFEAKVLPLADANMPILLDMSGVDYMSSAGLRALLIIYRHINEHAGHIVLVGLQDDIKDVMAITGFLEFFQTRDTLKAGMQALKNA